jgi:hypothetical protein
MCSLCLQNAFTPIDLGKTEKDRLKAKAIRLKQEISTHEMLLNQARSLDIEPCPTTVNGLERLRAEQFELSRLL